MVRFCLILLLSILFIGCDSTFGGNTSSQVEGGCLEDSDCNNNQLCNQKTRRCINVCIGISCGEHGECKNIKKDGKIEARCVCDTDYQDNNQELLCKKSCSLVDCGEIGSNGCDDKTGLIVCDCKNNYFQNKDNICENPCDKLSCSTEHGGCNVITNEECVNCETPLKGVCYCDLGYTLEDGECK
jgi:hypothetical protein